MRILIVDHDLFTRKKLAEVLSSFGSCESVSSGQEALQRFGQAVLENDPFVLVTLDLELKDIAGYDLLRQMRQVETHSGLPPARTIAVAAQGGQEEILKAVRNRCVGLLLRPVNREKTLSLLQGLNLAEPKSASGSPRASQEEAAHPISPSPKPSEPPATMGSLRQMLIDYVRNAGQATIQNLNRRLSDPTAESQTEISDLVLSAELDDYDKVHLMRWLQGYPRLDLVPVLSRLAGLLSNVKDKKETLLLLSKYENIDALQELLKLKDLQTNSILKDLVGSEVNRIRQKHPGLVLIERFLSCGEDRSAVQAVLPLLHKHLKAEQVPVFRRYLAHPLPSLREGAFEILCDMDDKNANPMLFPFLMNQLTSPAVSPEEPEEMQRKVVLAEAYRRYLQRFPFLAAEVGEDLYHRFSGIGSRLLQEKCLGFLLAAPDNRFLPLVLDAYRQKPELREGLLEKLAPVSAAGEFLLSEYRQGGEMTEKALAALMKNEFGVSFMAVHLEEQTQEQQILILNNITAGSYPRFRDLLFRFLQSADAPLKSKAMDLVCAFRDREAEPILFDPEQVGSHFRQGGAYFHVLMQLFPFAALTSCLQKECFLESLAAHEERQGAALAGLAAMEPVLSLRSRENMIRFVELMLEPGQSEGLTHCLKILKSLKALHQTSVRSIQEGLNLLQERRQQSMSPQEHAVLKSARDAANLLQEEVRQMENVYRDIDVCLKISPLNFTVLEDLLRDQPLAFLLRCTAVLKRLWPVYSREEEGGQEALATLLKKFPALEGLLAVMKAEKEGGGSAGLRSGALPRVNIVLEDKPLQYFLEDQFRDLCPFLPVVSDLQLGAADLWIADHSAFSLLGEDRLTAHPRKYLIYRNPTEYADPKRTKPVTFSVPVSIYRMVKTILPDFLLGL